MLFDRVNAKREARQIIRKLHPTPVLVTLFFLLLTSGSGQVLNGLLSNPFTEAMGYIVEGHDPVGAFAYVFGGGRAVTSLFLNILLGLLSILLIFGYNSYLLRISRGEHGDFHNLTDGFRMAVKLVLLDFVMGAMIMLGFLCFIIPGIVLNYSYAMAFFCLMDDPELSLVGAMRRSRQMMRGHKMSLFLTQMSFLGWVLLAGVVSNGLGTLVGGQLGGWVYYVCRTAFDLWLYPYMGIVTVKFYNCRIGRRDRSGQQGPVLEF